MDDKKFIIYNKTTFNYLVRGIDKLNVTTKHLQKASFYTPEEIDELKAHKSFEGDWIYLLW